MTASTFADVRSMTGQGRAQRSSDLGTVSAEIRAVNHRGVKCSLRTSDSLAALAPKIESTIRSRIHRGSLTVNVAWQPAQSASSHQVCGDVVAAYYRQLKSVQRDLNVDEPIDWVGLLQLPGALSGRTLEQDDSDDVWALVLATLIDALDQFDQMRQSEGAEMAGSLQADLTILDQRLVAVANLAPEAADRYRQRLESKVRQTLHQQDLSVDTVDLLREVQVYADRVDISEEITRLQSHLKLFAGVLDDQPEQESEEEDDRGRPDPTGRKLDFILQEMFRETNTIGSKAAGADVSTHVVEMKCALERMRELVQNLE